MNIKVFSISLFLFIAYSAGSVAQTADTAYNKARYYYDNQEYGLAVVAVSEYLVKKPDDYNMWKMRGNCYMETGQIEKAIQDYLFGNSIMPENADILYNLGNAYEKINKADSAIYYFQKYIALEPGKPSGYIRLSLLYMDFYPEKADSAIYFAGKAVKTGPEDPENLNFLAMAFYSGQKYKSALETAILGLEKDSLSPMLNQTAGISSFFLREYSTALFYFRRAQKSMSDNYLLHDYIIQSTLMNNTSPGKLVYLSSERVALMGISSEVIEKVVKQISEDTDIYTYKKLIRKFQSSPLTMGLDEFFMLYLGYTLQAGYAPYDKPDKIVNNINDLLQTAGNLEELLYKNPTNFPLYLSLADVYRELQNEEKYLENRFKYYGFIESIKATGDGLSHETAYIVNELSHEYTIMRHLGYIVKSQSFETFKRHNYDVLTATDSGGRQVLVYFNIDRPINTLNRKGKN